MKKIILFIVMFLLIPTVALADMGAPLIPEYEATVTNPDGAKCYEGYGEDAKVLKTLDYGTKITASFEDAGMVYINKYNCNIYVKDITATADSYDLEKSIKDDITREREALAKIIKKDLVIRKGPSEAYASTGVTIPKGTEISVKYVQDAFVYVEYKDTKGWIPILEGLVAFKYKTATVLFVVEDTTVKSDDGKVVATYKANDIVKDYFSLDDWTGGYYVEKNGVGGKLNNAYPYYQSSNVTSLKEFKVYEKASKDSKEVGTLSKSDKFVCDINFLDAKYEGMWYSVKTDNMKGWIYVQFEEEIGSTESLKFADDYFEKDEYKVVNDITPSEKPVTPSNPSGPTTGAFDKNIIIYAVGGAFIVALVAVVLILLLNKKKEVKKDE